MTALKFAGSVMGVLAAASASSSAAIIFGTTDNGTLIRFDSSNPTDILNAKPVGGLAQGERIVGIDFRPNDLNETADNVDETGVLYGLTSDARLIRISTNFGAAGPRLATTTVGSGLVLPAGLAGDNFGFDFNPTIDRIRVVSETDSNYVVNPDTGAGTVATPLFYAVGDVNEFSSPGVRRDPNIVASAYDNNDRNGATGSQLYGIDSNLNILVRQANSAGTLNTVGPLGWDPTAVIGFDIEAGTGIAYSAMIQTTINGPVSNLYTVNLGTGLTTLVGQINGGLVLETLTVAVPEPTTLGILGTAGLLLGRRRRA